MFTISFSLYHSLFGCLSSFPTPPKKQIVDMPSEDYDGDQYSENEGDLDDNDPTIYPNAPEICDGKDNDQNGFVDDDPQYHNEYYTDFDQDGFGDNTTRYTDCTERNSLDILVTTTKNDCDDNNENINPQAFELCDTVDNDCDGETDEDSAVNALAWYNDADGDGFGIDESLPSRACYQPEGYSNLNTDCDDSKSEINPSALEYCNDIDDDCDGQTDEGENNTAPVDAPTWYLDSDNDGYGFLQASIRVCTAPPNYVSDNNDCNDSDSAFYPDALEYCNNLDENCNGIIDENALDASTFYADQDNDGFGNVGNTIQKCVLPVGFVSDNTDCNDQNANISPESHEYCNGIDENCDGEIDEDALDRITYYADQDGDGFGNPNLSSVFCQLPEGFSANNFDCDDENIEHYPNAVEYCDEVDNNCDGVVDENTAIDTNTYYQDLDNDGYGLLAIYFESCNEPSGYASLSGDCDDGDANQRPEGIEICNGEDDDCDGLSDENAQDDPENPAIGLEVFYVDSDGDGHGSLESATDVALQIQNCPGVGTSEAPEGYAVTADDCDDTNSEIAPSVIEDCDAIDKNCDGDPRLGATDVSRWYVDSDKDGYGNPDIPFDSCLAPVGFIAQAGDCDDLDANANPEGTEICNGKLDDCDSDIERLNGIPWNESDEDGDGYVECDIDVDLSVWAGQEGILGGNDCDDNRQSSYPGSMYDALMMECMFDGDGDGYGDSDPPVGYDAGSDCDDDNIKRYPSAPELCNGMYDNCDDFLSYGDGIPQKEFDDDGDGFVECEGITGEWFGQEGILGDKDCDDDDIFAYPGAAELTSETECLRDATDFEGTGGPDGYADCRYGNCDYSYFQDPENGIAIDFVKVTRGSNLIHDFYMTMTEMTMGSYHALVGMDPWDECGYSYDLENNLQKPVNRISTGRSRKVANLLSEEKGYETCYDCSGTLNDTSCTLKEEFATSYDCKGYRLPSINELKRAIKPDTSKIYWTSDGGGNWPPGEHAICDSEVYLSNTSATPISSFAWYCYNSEDEIHDVAQLDPTAFGMYDLHGNLLELSDSGTSWGGYYGTNPEYTSLNHNYAQDDRCTDGNSTTFRLVRSAEDSAPTKPVVKISPDEPVVNETDVVCEITTPSIDPNGLEIVYEFAFYVDDVLYEGETSTTYLEGDTVPSQFLTERQNWTCTATPTDGTLEGETATSENYVEPFIRGACMRYDCDFGITLDAKENLGLDFKIIPAGSDPLERYEITYDFYMQVQNLTRLDFVEVEGYNPPSLCGKTGYTYVWSLSWHQMARFTNTLSEREGLESCYDCENLTLNAVCETASEFATDGIHTCEGYRLPTHAELEYTQRAGTDKDFWTPHGGADLLSYQLSGVNVLLDDGVGTYLRDYVYCYRNEVSSRLPNGFGILDINGLNYDMAHDSAGCDYPNGYTNPICDDPTQEEHVHVGGYYDQRPYQVVNGIYGTANPTCSNYYYSFRVARTIVEE